MSVSIDIPLFQFQLIGSNILSVKSIFRLKKCDHYVFRLVNNCEKKFYVISQKQCDTNKKTFIDMYCKFLILAAWLFALRFTLIWSFQWRHNGRDSVSNHQPHDCLLNGLFRRRSKKTSTFRVTGLCAGNSPGTGEFPAQMASDAEKVSIWWRHHVLIYHVNFMSWTTTSG